MLRKRPGSDLPDYPNDIFEEPAAGESIASAAGGEVKNSSVGCLTQMLSIGKTKKQTGKLGKIVLNIYFVKFYVKFSI